MMRRAILVAVAVAIVLMAGFAWLSYDKAVEHGDRMALEGAVTDALNGPGGPDYARAVAIYRDSRMGADEKRLAIATTTLAACDERKPPCIASPGATRKTALDDLRSLADGGKADVRGRARDWLQRQAKPR